MTERTQDTDISERFWDKVDEGDEDECWLWQSATGDDGYGRFHNKSGDRLAHRVAYSLACGEIPKGGLVLHKCDVKGCVNPSHLYIGDKKDNAQDAINRGQIANGEDNGSAKLNESEVIEIRKKAANGRTHRSLADEYGMSQGGITMIIQGERWGHVRDPTDDTEDGTDPTDDAEGTEVSA